MKKTCLLGAAFAASLVFSLPSYAAPVQWTSGSGGNDHWYEVISSTSITWGTADTAASGMTHLGQSGYLATITTAGEDAFIFNLLSTSTASGEAYWLGGSDSVTEGEWFWDRGPESGTQFWTGGSASSGGSAVTYANWKTGNEPNNLDALHTSANYLAIQRNFDDLLLNGMWRDRNADGTDQIIGYVVEYAPVPVPAAVWLFGSGLLGLFGIARRKKV